MVDAFIAFLPEALAGDGRDIKDRLEDEMKANDTGLALDRLTRRVARAADPAMETARLALSLAPAGISAPVASFTPTPGSGAAIAAAAAGRASAAKSQQPTIPPSGASDANVTRQQVQSWVAHAVATVDKKAGKGQAGNERTGKAKERGGRLPNDAWCKAGSCQYRHDEKFPNKPCYRNPDWDGGAEGLNYEIVSNPTRIARLLEDREKAGVRLGKKVKKLKYATGPAPAAAAVTCPGCDGLDDWAGGHASVSLGSFSSSPLAPCCPAAHTSLLNCSSVTISAELLEAQGLDDAELAALVIDDLDDSRDGPSSSRSSTPTT